MESLNRWALGAILAFGLSTLACGGGDQVTTEKVRMMIKNELAVGSSSQDIEQFFKTHNLVFSYDKFSKRYQSIIRNVSPDPGVDQAIVIYLYVDDEKKFTREEVRDSFTAP